MFTGIIKDVGQVYRWAARKSGATLVVTTHLPLRKMAIGSSVAVNGACLTVAGRAKARFTVDLSPETTARTNLSRVQRGELVNLELPLRLQDRLDGHFVTGHVDGVGVIEEISKKGEFAFFSFRVAPLLGSLLVPKGSVAIDGISLTVNECKKQRFSVAIIPFTLKHTNLRERKVGDKVNLETDMIGKYIQRLMQHKL